MNKFLLTVSALVIFTMPAFAADDNLAARMELAKEYSRIVPVDVEVKKTIDQLAIQVPVDRRVLFRDILERTINVNRLQTASELALVDLFTAEELSALVTFYKTTEGQAIRKKMPDYQAQIQPVLEQMIKNSAESLQEQIKK